MLYERTCATERYAVANVPRLQMEGQCWWTYEGAKSVAHAITIELWKDAGWIEVVRLVGVIIRGDTAWRVRWLPAPLFRFPR